MKINKRGAERAPISENFQNAKPETDEGKVQDMERPVDSRGLDEFGTGITQQP
jgi:hypothetical protein